MLSADHQRIWCILLHYFEVSENDIRTFMRGTNCSLRALWQRVDLAVRDVLIHITLEDLRRKEPEMIQWLDSPPTQTVEIA